MRVKPIVDSLPGEHIVAVHPVMSPDAEAHWHRRLNLYTGRALSDIALTAEQEGRAGRLATSGQMLSPGVVSGLEVTVDSTVEIRRPVEPPGKTVADPVRQLPVDSEMLMTRNADLMRLPVESDMLMTRNSNLLHLSGGISVTEATKTVGSERTINSYYNLAPGFGITGSGEDVNLPTPLRLDVKSVPVYAPSLFLDNAERILRGEGRSKMPAVEKTPIVAPNLEETGPDAAAPSQPLAPRHEGPTLGELIHPLIDLPPVGVLLLQPIVAELVGEYDPADSCEEDPSNYAFEDWQRADGCRLLFYTWPLDWMPLPGSDQYWRNRIAYAIFNAERRNQPHELLPWEEVGVPIALVGFDASWNIEFVDRHSVVREGGRRKRRKMFIPKSGNPFLWQARLKQFAEQLAETDGDDKTAADLAAQFRYLPPIGVMPRKAVELVTGPDVTDSRVRRNNFFPSTYRVDAVPIPLEQLDMAMTASASMSPFDTFTPDRVQVLVPVPQVWFEPDLLKVEAVAHEFQKEIDTLNAKIDDSARRRKDVRQKHRTLVRTITAGDPTYVEGDPVTDAQISPAEPEFGTQPKRDANGNKVFRQDGKPVLLVGIVDDLKQKLETTRGKILGAPELDQFDPLGLEGFVNFLKDRVDRASDRIDFGFLRVQTDIYRVRQLILNNVAATRLATSPVLASIAQGDSAIATKADIQAFLDAAKTKKEPPTNIGGAPPAASTGTTTSPATISGTLSSATFTTKGAIAELAFGKVAAMSAKTKLAAEATGRIFEQVSAPPSKVVVEQKSPLIGQKSISRSVTIAERIQDPKAAESKNYCVATKYDVIKSLRELGIMIDDIEIPGLLLLNADGNVVLEDDEKSVNFRLPKRETLKFADILDLEKRILSEPVDPGLDEGKAFSIGVELLENIITVLRSVEARIQDYEKLISLCQTVLDQTRDLLSGAERRLSELEHDLAEARHDITVARALLVDEQNRVGQINEQRDRVIREQVTFLAYQRPRLVDLNAGTPTRTLDPAVVTSPVPACLGHDATIPSDLRSTIGLLRESPVKWFPNVHPLLARLDRIEMLHQTIQTAKQRALAQTAVAVDSAKATAAPTRAGIAIQQAFFSQRSVVTQFRAQTAQIDLGVFANQSWRFAHDQAKDIVSLGDVIEAAHGRTDLAQEAAGELEGISRIAGCLYANFGSVKPEIRLDWVEAFSQYDRPVNFRNLAVLPRWHEIGFLDRRETQALVDWLYQQVDPLQSDAVSLINDVVRICILLASHAPVNQIVAGHIPKATVVQTGGHVELAVDHTKIRVGMSVLMYSPTNEVVARGVVEDLAAGKAAARVVTAVTKETTLEPGARVHFAESRALELNPLTAGKNLR
jgi:hypothetical protein